MLFSLCELCTLDFVGFSVCVLGIVCSDYFSSLTGVVGYLFCFVLSLYYFGFWTWVIGWDCLGLSLLEVFFWFEFPVFTWVGSHSFGGWFSVVLLFVGLYCLLSYIV